MKFALQPCRVVAVQAALVRHNIGECEDVKVKDLICSQFNLSAERLCTLAVSKETWPPVATVRFGGKLFLVDGNHRAMVAFLRGDETISSWHIDL